jgi:hypothetical protein
VFPDAQQRFADGFITRFNDRHWCNDTYHCFTVVEKTGLHDKMPQHILFFNDSGSFAVTAVDNSNEVAIEIKPSGY